MFGMKGDNRIRHIGPDGVKKLQGYFCTAGTSVLLGFTTFDEFNTFPVYHLGNYTN